MPEKKYSKSLAAKKSRRMKMWRNIGIAAGAVALVAIILVSYFTSTTYYRQKTAVEVGGNKISVATFNYYYRNAYQNTYNTIVEQYGDYASMLLDTSIPLSEQQYTDDQTWEDYLTEETLSDISEIYALYDDAMKNGYVLDEEANAEIESVMAEVAQAAEDSNYSLDNYLMYIYGKGINAKLYRELLTKISIAGSYAADVEEGLAFTDAEMDEFYENNRNSVDTVEARIYPISFAAAEDATEETEDDAAEETEDERTYEEAKALAEGVYDCTTDEEFINYVVSIVPEESAATYADGSNFLYSGLSYDSFNNAELSDWLFDMERSEGDVTYIETESEIYIAFFLSRTDNDYALVDMRHILIAPATDEDGAELEGANEIAETTARTLYDEFIENGSAEDYFAELANDNSADGDGTTGGLYEAIYNGQMVEPINSWLFEDGRAVGDCEVMESTYGWHVVYYVGTGENYREQRIENIMRTNAYTEWRESIMEGYDAVINESGFEMTR